MGEIFHLVLGNMYVGTQVHNYLAGGPGGVLALTGSIDA